MRADKATLACGGRPQLDIVFELLEARVAKAWVSVRPEQRAETVRAAYPQIVDGPGVEGPIAGIMAAQAARPDTAWLVVACDLPLLDAATLDELLAGRDERRLATAFASSSDGLPEPLCAIYEPASREPIRRYAAAGGSCPRKFLIGHDVALLTPTNARALDNANTPEELAAARTALGPQEIA